MPCQTQQPHLNIVSISRSAPDLIQTYQSTRLIIRSLTLACRHILVFDCITTQEAFNVLIRVEPSVIQIVQDLPGISHAFNAATHCLSPGFVLYLNASDVFSKISTPNLHHLISSITSVEPDLIVCKSYLLPRTVIPRPYVKYAYSSLRLPFILARLPHQATLINTKHIFSIPYRASLRVRMDYCFFYTLLREHRKIVFLDILLSTMSPGGVSSNLSDGYDEELRIHQMLDKHSLIHSSRISLTLAIKSLLASLLDSL